MSDTQEILADLSAARQTMRRQIALIDDIMKKSNSTLLHIEAQNNMKTTKTPPSADETVYNWKPECELALVTILEQFQQLMQQTVDGNDNESGPSVLDGCLAYRQRVEYLGSNVRKLVALCNTVGQMKVQQQECEDNQEGEDNQDTDD